MPSMGAGIKHFADMRCHHFGDATQERFVGLGERVAGVAVNINLRNKLPVQEHRHDYLRFSFDTAREVVSCLIYVGNGESGKALRGLTTDSASVWNLRVVGRRPAKRTEDQKPLFGNGEIESEPIVVRDLSTKQITDKLQTLPCFFGRRQ